MKDRLGFSLRTMLSCTQHNLLWNIPVRCCVLWAHLLIFLFFFIVVLVVLIILVFKVRELLSVQQRLLLLVEVLIILFILLIIFLVILLIPGPLCLHRTQDQAPDRDILPRGYDSIKPSAALSRLAVTSMSFCT